MPVHLGLDLMGGDLSPSHLFNEVCKNLSLAYDKLHLHVFVTTSIAKSIDPDLLESKNIELTIHECEEFIQPDDDPLSAARLKKQSSMAVGISHLSQGLDGFITLGNTGALIALSKLHLPMIEGVIRPALIALMPTKKSHVAIVDVGANINCNSQLLVQFAHLGLALKRSLGKWPMHIGLLNIGSEKGKGDETLRQAYKLLSEDQIISPHFMGNIESFRVFQGDIDVLVTDGFTGNIFLKTSEGLSQFILEVFQGISTKSDSLKLARDIIYQCLSHSTYPGALVAGIKPLVFKCHGSADAKDICGTISQALNFVKAEVVQKMQTFI